MDDHQQYVSQVDAWEKYRRGEGKQWAADTNDIPVPPEPIPPATSRNPKGRKSYAIRCPWKE